MSDPAGVPVGPLARAVTLNDKGGLRTRHGRGKRDSGKAGVNPLVMLRRTAFVTWTHGSTGEEDRCRADNESISRLLCWADQENLGQDPELITQTHARRTRSLRALAADGHTVVRLRARVQWRLITGMGAKDNAHEIGIALHGTYGWPILPASGLKGLAAAWAAHHVSDPAAVDAVFGTPRPKPAAPPETSDPDAGSGASDPGPRAGQGETARGGVLFLDAFPAQPATICRDVLTPHVQPYYTAAEKQRADGTDGADSAAPSVPPAEHHNPVPVPFLTVQRSTFAVDLAARDPDAVRAAANWLRQAADELGAGAKTSAGYGYLEITPNPEWPLPFPFPDSPDPNGGSSAA